MSMTLEHIDPTTLRIDPGKNIRSSLRLTAEFVDSIRDEGVLVPIFAVRVPSGDLLVRMGHRRTAAAVHAGLATVPVVIGDDIDDVSRIVHQYAENAHRQGLNDTDRIRVVEQLAAFGISAGQIAKRTKAPRTTVDASIAVAGLPNLRDRVGHDLTLDEAAVYAEFDGDDTATARLDDAIRYGHDLTHTAQRLRDAAQERVERAAAAEPFAAQGYTILDTHPDNAGPYPLHALRTADGDPVTDEHLIGIEPTDLAVRFTQHAVVVDRVTGEPVDSDDIDPDTYDASDDFEPEDGYRHANTVIETTEWTPAFHVIDPGKHGFTRLGGYWSNGQPNSQPQAESEIDAAKDAATAERRRVVSHNKAWRAAESVRRTWLTAFATRRAEPRGAAEFVAIAIANTPELITHHNTHSLACSFLGLEPAQRSYRTDSPIVAKILGEKDTRIHHVTILMLVLAGYEAATSPDSWRHLAPGTATYFRFLEANGYRLSNVERIAAGEHIELEDDAMDVE